MSGRTKGAIGVALMALGVAVALVALWWWALAGLSQPVGMAAGLTAFAVGFAGLMAWIVGSES